MAGGLLGRDGVLADLTAAAAAARMGAGAVVLLTGEAGIGKTSVARDLAARVRDDLLVSWGKGVADGSAPPFWPWRALLADDPTVSADPTIGAERFDRLNQLREQLEERVRQGPRLHIIEDLQWGDVASVLLLSHVTAGIVDLPLLVLATVRTGEVLARPLEEAIEEVRRAGEVRELPPLGDDDVATLIRDAGVDPSPELTALVQSRTGGNPLFVTELLRTVRALEQPDRRLEALARSVPGRVSELVAHRVARLPAPVSDVLVTASVVGTEGDVRTLASARSEDTESVLDLLDQARAAHLLELGPPGRWQFRHQLIRDAVYAGVPGSSRARHHAAVLEALQEDASTPVPVVAHHALAAQPLFDPDRAVALAARAGESAFAQHAYEQAVVWFERALQAAPSATAPRWRAELLVLCGEAHRHIGEIDEARRAFVDASGLTDDPALLARAALGHADPGADLGIAYRTDDAMTGELLERAIAAQPAGDSVTSVLLEARLAAVLYFSDEPGRARELGRTALDRAHRLQDDRALAVATAVHHDSFVIGQAPMDEQLQESEQLLAWARASGLASGLLTAHRARVFDLLAAGDLAAMDAEIVAFRRLADPLRAPGYLWWPALWGAMRALLEGRHDDAEAQSLAAFEIGSAPFPTLAFTNLSFLLFFLRREQGRFEEMEQPTRDYVAGHADIPALRVALMFLLAEIGRIDEARGLLTSVDDVALERLHDRNWPASWFQLARAAFLTGDRDLAATLLDDRHRPSERCVMVSLATACLGAADLATAWLLHTVGDLDAADERYAVAATINSRIGARGWLAQTRADHAGLLLVRDLPGDREAAAVLVDLAAEAAQAIGMASLGSVLEGLRGRPSATGASFRRVGAVWELEFGERTARIPHAAGLRDLAFLLVRPDQAVSVLELTDDGGLGAGSSEARGAPALDERARREIRDRLHELDAAEAQAESDGDGERAALVREERQALAEAVARDYGLGGRSRRVGDPVERARKTVSTRIRRAIAHVGDAHPELGRHLERSIDTGAWCAYRPAEPVAWTF
jgi:tetratricopeptide (TPR) repeat protein